jgi:hypothetical protein
LLVLAIGVATPLGWAAGAQESQTTGTTFLAGRVIDRVSGAPVVGARVEVTWRPTARLGAKSPSTSASGSAALHQLSNEKGEFAFAKLPAGRYGIVVRKDGYLTGTYNPVPASSSPYSESSMLSLSPGERLDRVTLVLWPTGSIRGMATDAQNEAIVRASVQLFSREPAFGRLVWRHHSNATLTDDRGIYEFSRVEPGEYIVVLPRQRQGVGPLVSARASRSLSPEALAALEGKLSAQTGQAEYPTTFHPGSPTLAGALIVNLGAGEHLTNINIVTAPAVSTRVAVSGRVVGAPLPLPPLTVRLVPQDAAPELADLEGLSSTTSKDGAFAFTAVPVGQYRLQAWVFPPAVSATTLSWGTVPSGRNARPPGPLPAGPTWLADVPISLDKPVAGLSVALNPAGRIIGQVRMDPAASPVPLDRLPGVAVTFLSLDREVGPVPYSGISREGQFSSVGLPAGRYRMEIGTLQVAGMEEWWYPISEVDGRRVSVIELGERDVRVTVTLTNRPTPLSGTVRDAKRQPLPGASVIIFPQDPQAWSDELAVRLQADRHGRIETRRLFPGDYLAAAVSSTPRFWKTPEYFSSIRSHAVPLRIELGESRTLDVVVPDGH